MKAQFIKKLSLLIIVISVIFSACSSKKGLRVKPQEVTIALNLRADNSLNFTNINMDFYSFNLKRAMSEYQYVTLDYVEPEDKPQIVLDVTVENFTIYPRQERTYRRTYSARVQSGTDAAGKPIISTVTATAEITETSIRSNARLSFRLTFKDSNPAKSVSQSYFDTYVWQSVSVDNIQGDQRAIDPSLYSLNRMGIEPTAEDILTIISRRQMTGKIGYEIRKYYPKPKT